MRSVFTIADLSDDDIDSILLRASELKGGSRIGPTDRRFVLALIFLEPSLRTRVGFSTAAARLGWNAVEVSEQRHSPTSMTESWADTLRTMAGYADVIVARPARPLGRESTADKVSCPIINGGDIGPNAEHPSQALIDLFAIEQLVGPVADLRLAIVGDPRMRAVRSLIGLLTRRPPRDLLVVADPEQLQTARVLEETPLRMRVSTWSELTDVDVVYVAGIPHESLPLDRRRMLLATGARVRALKQNCVLLSPMPVIDEMDAEARRDQRNRMFDQSDLALYVRMALLEHVIRYAA